MSADLHASATMHEAEESFRRGRTSDARKLYERAIEQGERSGVAQTRLATIASQESRLEEAVALAQEAVAGAPTDAEHHYVLGRMHKARGNLDAAEQAYRQAVRLRPGHVDTWISLGILLRQLERFAEAEQCYREALLLDPRSFLGQLNLGNVLLAQSRTAEAAERFRAATEVSPTSAQAQYSLGAALAQLEDKQAAKHFAEALKLEPKHFEAAVGLGKILAAGDLYDQAIEAFRMALRVKPADPDARLRLCNAYFNDRKLDAARVESERLSQEYPAWFEARETLATVLKEQGHFTRPKVLYEQLLEQDPGHHRARANYALLLIRHGDFERAWDYYESRWPGALPRGDAFERDFGQPRWAGEPLAGKTLLITREQGLGDELLFSSIVPDLLQDAAHCMIECDRRLEPLFRRSFRGATVVGVDGSQQRGELEQRLNELPRFDYWTPIGSLPRYRRRAAQSFPAHDGYLRADAERTEHWKQRLNELGSGLKIGLSWRGGTRFTGKTARSISLEQLSSVLATRGVHWVSVQYGKRREEIDAFSASSGVAIHHWQEAIDDYDETAALVNGLDLVLSVCTAVVNLGGALNRPVWVMAPLVPDSRYGWQGESTIWYPSLRVFRQARLDDWRPVIAEVGRALRKLRAQTDDGGKPTREAP